MTNRNRFIRVVAVANVLHGSVQHYHKPRKIVINAGMVGEAEPHEYPTEFDKDGNPVEDGKMASGSMICIQVGRDRVITMTPAEFMAAADPPDPEPEAEEETNDPPPKEKK